MEKSVHKDQIKKDGSEDETNKELPDKKKVTETSLHLSVLNEYICETWGKTKDLYLIINLIFVT